MQLLTIFKNMMAAVTDNTSQKCFFNNIKQTKKQKNKHSQQKCFSFSSTPNG